jgi:hypothetical protein
LSTSSALRAAAAEAAPSPGDAVAGVGLNETLATDELQQRRRPSAATDAGLLLLVLLDSDAAAGVNASICRRATVSAFAEKRLDAERASGAPAASPQSWYERGAVMWRGSSTPNAAALVPIPS